MTNHDSFLNEDKILFYNEKRAIVNQYISLEQAIDDIAFHDVKYTILYRSLSHSSSDNFDLDTNKLEFTIARLSNFGYSTIATITKYIYSTDLITYNSRFRQGNDYQMYPDKMWGYDNVGTSIFTDHSWVKDRLMTYVLESEWEQLDIVKDAMIEHRNDMAINLIKQLISNKVNERT